MKQGRKLLSVLLAVLLLVGCLPLSASAIEISSGTCGAAGNESKVTWSLSDTGVLTISGTGAMKDYYHNLDPSPWYEYKEKIETVLINEGVTHIGDTAFWQCNMTSVSIPASVTEIGGTLVGGVASVLESSRLTKITVAANNKNFVSEDGVLFTKNKAKLLCYPQGKTGAYVIPEGVKTMEYDAFSYCTGLTGITIPASMTNLTDSNTSDPFDQFSECPSLTRITVSKESKSFADQDGVLFNKDKTILIRCPGKKAGAYVIPNSVTSIASGAFEDCSGLTSIDIPENVTSIGGMAFSDCSGLTSISIPKGITVIKFATFSGCNGLTRIIIPEGVTDIGTLAFSDCTSLTYVSIPESVTIIRDFAFYGCTSLQTVTIPKSVTCLVERAFMNCSSLRKAVFEGNVPTFDLGNSFFFLGAAEDFCIYYADGATGWTTPTWSPQKIEVYACKPISEMDPEISIVTLDPVSAQVKKGSTQQFTATVDGVGTYDKTVTWSVTGGTSGTSISSTGLLTVSADEKPNTVLTVTATSVGDNTQNDTVIVIVASDIAETKITETGNIVTVTTQTNGDREIAVKTSTGETIAKLNLLANPGAGKKFADVKGGAWYAGAVDRATAYGLFDGSTETTFAPNGSMTRGMVAQVLYNLSGKTGYGVGTGNFTDVTTGKWYESAIDWAAKSRIVAGMGNGRFSPERAVTREQLVAMLYNYAQAIGADTKNITGLASFPDSREITDYAETAMKWAVAEGFISGREQSDGNYIAPKGTATRAEVAAILTRFVEFLK